MKLVNTVGQKREPFDVAAGLAEIFLHLKVAERFIPHVPDQLKSDSIWRLFCPGEYGATSLGLSALYRSCSSSIDFFMGPNPSNAELRHRAHCSGGIEFPPQDLCERYSKAWEIAHPKSLTEKAIDRLAEFRESLKSGATVGK
jgi:hypothetical protein